LRGDVRRRLADAAITAVDLSLGLGLSVLPLQIDDMAAGVTLRATMGSSIVSDSASLEWYAITPMLTLVFSDEDPISISVGYGPYAQALLSDFFLYAPAVLLGFQFDTGLMEIGMIGHGIVIGIGLVLWAPGRPFS
jgi:hypothetical protein